MDANKFIDGVINDVAELPDRSSPEDQPDMMLVTVDELRKILTDRLTTTGLELIIEEIEEERTHFSVLGDGPGRFVLRDDRSDDPAEVFPTEADALAEIDRRVGQ